MIGSKVPLSDPHRCIKVSDLAVQLYVVLYFYAYLCLTFNLKRFRRRSCLLFLVLALDTGAGNLKIQLAEGKTKTW